ncbi:tyrosine-type recombinase/integrase [Aeromicrobium sp. Leaf291]|uniref:tyrosine-type recombinase/integrase n=1 Tax=Aeromicrobium sp. Leaf291 TaxID=1736325 RepID=UPI0009EC4A08|nr:tyrosine-type recombinase/integrase [Aeromicrobium sp. Leaf291]
MAIRRDGDGWLAVVKHGRDYVGSKKFDTRRDAVDWERSFKARLAAGIDVKAGRVTVAARLLEWATEREGMVAETTLVLDRDLSRVLPTWFAALSVNAVTEAHVERVLMEWIRTRSHGSVTRYRAALSAFFSSCVRARLVTTNPVTNVRPPRRTEPPTEMTPFAEDELNALAGLIAHRNRRLADVVLLAGWTGLRWGELRALRVRDLVIVPEPTLIVQRSQTEGRSAKVPKSGRTRRVPLADHLLPIVQEMARDKGADDLLVTTDRGAQLHATAFKRATDWQSLGRGRRIHDLRHTAVCLWLARGVEPGTVKAWAGHSSIAVTDKYVHYLGTAADRAARGRLNAPGASVGQVQRDGSA